MGRLVITHSTYIDGLIPKLKKLSTKNSIKTITPGVIKRIKNHCQDFRIKISVQIKNGYKLIARQGRTCQEIFIVTELERSIIEKYLNELE